MAKSQTIDDLIKKMSTYIEVQELKAKNESSSLSNAFEQSINKSKIKDKKLLAMIKEQSTATGDYSDRIKSLTDAYIKEQKDAGKLGVRASKKIADLLEKQTAVQEAQLKEAKITKEIERKKELSNPFMAFSHAFEDFKDTFKKEGLKSSLKKGSSTLGGDLKESAKQQLTFKNFSKGLLHTAGVALDLPALNILASNIQSDIKDRKESNIKMNEFVDSLKEMDPVRGRPKNQSSVLDNASASLKHENTIYGNQDDYINELKDIKSISSDMSIEVNKNLQDIYTVNSNMDKAFHDYLYLQKDQANDNKSNKNLEKDIFGSKKNLSSDMVVDGGSSGGLGDMAEGGILSAFMNSKWGAKVKGVGKGATSFLGKKGMVGKLGAPIAALLAGYSKYTDVKDEKGLTTAQKTTQVASTGIGAGGGALAGAAAGAAIGSVVPVVGTLIGGLAGGALGALAGTKLGDTIGAWMSSKESSDKESTAFVNQLDSAGIVKTHWLGNSQVEDWNKVNLLNSQQIKAMLKYDDWDSKTTSLLQKLYIEKAKREKISGVKTSEPNIVSQVANSTASTTSKVPTNTSGSGASSPTVTTDKQQAPVVVVQGEKNNNRKIDAFNSKYNQQSEFLMDNGY